MLEPHREFLEALCAREARRYASGALRPVSGGARRQGRHLVDEPLPSPSRLYAQKKTLVAREQDRPDVSARRRGASIKSASIRPAWSSSTRLDQDQHGAPSRLGAARTPAGRQGPSRPLEHHDLPCRPAPRPGRGALAVRRPDQRRALPRLRRAVPGSDPQAGRHRHHRQSRLTQGKAVRQAIRAAGASLLFLPKYSPDLNPIEQFFAKLKRSSERPRHEPSTPFPTPSQTPSPPSPKRMRKLSPTPAMRTPKRRRL